MSARYPDGMTVRGRASYGAIFVLLFAVELAIAIFVHDRLIRPFFGDVLAVVAVYCGLRTVLPIGVRAAVLSAFGVGCVLELLQLLDVADRLALGPVARVVIGTTFDPGDLVAYAVGAAIALGVEQLIDWRGLADARTRPRSTPTVRGLDRRADRAR